MAGIARDEALFQRLVTAYKRGGLMSFVKRLQAMDDRDWIAALAFAVTREAKKQTRTAQRKG